MNFRNLLFAGCALAMCAAAATAQVPSYVPTNGLVGWWPFNGNANDESGNGNDGVVNGATLTEDRNGAPNAAYSFDGVSYISGNDSSFPSGDNDRSICFWTKPTLIDNNYHLVFGYGTYSSNNLCSFGIHNSNNNFYYSTKGNSLMVQEAIADSLFHIAVSLSEGVYSFYINGVFINSGNLYTNTILNSFYFGRDVAGGGFVGVIDDIAIYNRALTPQEIQNLYAGSNETVDTGNGAAPLPQGIPYQAAARDAQGQSLVNAAVNVRFTLHEGAADGAASYAETHALTTNGVGLFNTVFGNGTPEQSAFDSINWAATTKFLQVEIDLGEGYVDMGTTQLLSVPYALRSDEAARVKNAGLPIFNDNAAALAGGLVAGEMYRTSAGVLMIVY